MSFAQHFSDLSNPPQEAAQAFDSNEIDTSATSQINCLCAADELTKSIRKLKNNKANGIDCTNDELTKNCADGAVNLITAFFNLCLQSGLVPTE